MLMSPTTLSARASLGVQSRITSRHSWLQGGQRLAGQGQGQGQAQGRVQGLLSRGAQSCYPSGAAGGTRGFSDY